MSTWNYVWLSGAALLLGLFWLRERKRTLDILKMAAPRGFVFGVVRVNRDLHVDRSDEWAILYQPRCVALIPPSLMPVAELEAHLDAIEH